MKNHDKVMIEVTPEEIRFWMDQQETITAFFEARDEMNARVHLATVKWSPVTLAAQELRTFLGGMWAETTRALANK